MDTTPSSAKYRPASPSVIDHSAICACDSGFFLSFVHSEVAGASSRSDSISGHRGAGTVAFDQEGLVPPLEQVPGAIAFGIPVGVSTEPVLHAGRQIGLGSSQEKVDVIWHPAIGDHIPSRALHFVGQTVGESVIVAVVMKDCPATITARDDVVNRTGEL